MGGEKRFGVEREGDGEQGEQGVVGFEKCKRAAYIWLACKPLGGSPACGGEAHLSCYQSLVMMRGAKERGRVRGEEGRRGVGLQEGSMIAGGEEDCRRGGGWQEGRSGEGERRSEENSE